MGHVRGRRGSPEALGGRGHGEVGGLSGFAISPPGSPPGSPPKLQLARWGRFLANTEISQCLSLFLPSVHGKILPTPGAEKAFAWFSQLRLQLWLGNPLLWDPPAQEGGAHPADVPQGKRAQEASHGEGMYGLLLHLTERYMSQRLAHTGGNKVRMCGPAYVSV